MMGLAQQSAQAPQLNVQMVIQMLKQGMKPEELIQKGVPEELVKAAMQMLMQEAQGGEERTGLAETVVQPMQEGK